MKMTFHGFNRWVVLRGEEWSGRGSAKDILQKREKGDTNKNLGCIKIIPTKILVGLTDQILAK